MDSRRLENKLKTLLFNQGDSLIVLRMGDRLRIHIHSDASEKIVQMLLQYGTILEQKADDMLLQAQVKANQKSRIGILTDSIADLPDEIKLEYQVHTMPIGLTFEDVTYLDKRTIQLAQLSNLLKHKESYPTCSQPEPGRVQKMLRDLSEQYDAIMIISVSSKMSGTYQTFAREVEAFKREGKQIALIDSKLNSGAQGMVVMEAAKLASLGWNFDDLVEWVEKMAERTKIYVCLHTPMSFS